MHERSSTSRAELHVPHDALAVSIHDVEPATFTRVALIRDWLDDHGVDRVTLLVVPAPGLHPFSSSSPELAEWLLDRADRGDAIAQHVLSSRTRLSPLALRASAVFGGPLLRLDLRPADLEDTRRMLALERVLRRARRRTAVTYGDLAA